MANDATILSASTLVEAAIGASGGTAVKGLKRGYGSESISPNTNVVMHQGVALMPSRVQAVASATAADATATWAGAANTINYLTGFSITGGGATLGSVVKATITGIGYTWTIDVGVVAGVLLGITPIIVILPNPMAATAASAAITLTVPSFGSGNTGVDIAILGYTSPA